MFLKNVFSAATLAFTFVSFSARADLSPEDLKGKELEFVVLVDGDRGGQPTGGVAKSVNYPTAGGILDVESSDKKYRCSGEIIWDSNPTLAVVQLHLARIGQAGFLASAFQVLNLITADSYNVLSATGSRYGEAQCLIRIKK